MKRIFFVVIIATAFAMNISAQKPPDDVQNRIKQLEAQVQAMQAQLEELKKAMETPAQPVKTEAQKPAAAAEKKPEPEKKAPGFEIANGVRVVPYGTIYINAYGNSGGTNNGDVPTFATPTGSGNVGVTVRQTRLGLRIEGAKVGKAKLSAIFEGDFYGGFPSVGIGENMGVFRVRLANARLDWEKTSMTIGQDWMVFAPLSPTSLASAGIPQMAAAGNLWARLPQFKAERKLTPNVTLQGAVLAPQTGDFATSAAFFVQPTSGAASRVPFLQSRLSFSGKNWFESKKPGSIAISGHYGRSRVFTGTANRRNDLESVGVAADWNLPLTNRFSIIGEAFFGRNLGGFQGGVFQSYNNDFAYRQGVPSTAGGVRAIGTRGGWLQLAFTPPVLKDRLGIYGTVGIDDPKNDDLTSISNRDWRLRNFALAGEVIYKFTSQFSIAVELRRFHTNYFLSRAQHANHVNLGASYSF